MRSMRLSITDNRADDSAKHLIFGLSLTLEAALTRYAHLVVERYLPYKSCEMELKRR